MERVLVLHRVVCTVQIQIHDKFSQAIDQSNVGPLFSFTDKKKKKRRWSKTEKIRPDARETRAAVVVTKLRIADFGEERGGERKSNTGKQTPSIINESLYSLNYRHVRMASMWLPIKFNWPHNCDASASFLSSFRDRVTKSARNSRSETGEIRTSCV